MQRSLPDNGEALAILETLYEKTYDRKFGGEDTNKTAELKTVESKTPENEEDELAKELEMQLQAELEDKN